jgi:hypothetical protein
MAVLMDITDEKQSHAGEFPRLAAASGAPNEEKMDQESYKEIERRIKTGQQVIAVSC